jgi:hypothetical protein
MNYIESSGWMIMNYERVRIYKEELVEYFMILSQHSLERFAKRGGN